jgi:hypothetical protein
MSVLLKHLTIAHIHVYLRESSDHGLLPPRYTLVYTEKIKPEGIRIH